jgi:hypothetical protein
MILYFLLILPLDIKIGVSPKKMKISNKVRQVFAALPVVFTITKQPINSIAVDLKESR